MTTPRDEEIESFLDQAGWRRAVPSVLAGDASTRRYQRLTAGPDGARAVLMDADPALGQDVHPFLTVARHLASLGFSAPEILAADASQGLVLLEDLGDAVFARLLEHAPDREAELYGTATDLLIDLARAPIPEFLVDFEPDMAGAIGPAFDWYARGLDGADEMRIATMVILEPMIESLANLGRCLIHRDFHAENLIWLPQRNGLARVGLLDFQDALAGPCGYDLISLIRDARRDPRPETAAAIRAQYGTALGIDAETLETGLAVMGAQRNLRILGVFARLCLHHGKQRYIDLIPRVWALLQADLAHPALAPLAQIIARLPEPTEAHLDDMRNRCGTVLTLS